MIVSYPTQKFKILLEHFQNSCIKSNSIRHYRCVEESHVAREKWFEHI
jgi:hypothetical protein